MTLKTRIFENYVVLEQEFPIFQNNKHWSRVDDTMDLNSPYIHTRWFARADGCGMAAPLGSQPIIRPFIKKKNGCSEFAF